MFQDCAHQEMCANSVPYLRKYAIKRGVLALLPCGFSRHDVDIAAKLVYNPQRYVMQRLIFVQTHLQWEQQMDRACFRVSQIVPARSATTENTGVGHGSDSKGVT